MGSSAIALALVAVGVFVLGQWLGHRRGRAGAQTLLDQASASERELARTREQAQEQKYNQMSSLTRTLPSNRRRPTPCA